MEQTLGVELRDIVAEEQKETETVGELLIEVVALEHEDTLDERHVEPE